MLAFATHHSLVTNLPRNKVTDVVGYQLLKSGTSIVVPTTGGKRCESRDDFIHRTAIVEKEAAETEYLVGRLHGCRNRRSAGAPRLRQSRRASRHLHEHRQNNSCPPVDAVIFPPIARFCIPGLRFSRPLRHSGNPKSEI